MAEGTGCRGCSASVHLPEIEVERVVAAYAQRHPYDVADDATYRHRLGECARCEHLRFGTTCGHSGALVRARARAASKDCPLPGGSRWADARSTHRP